MSFFSALRRTVAATGLGALLVVASVAGETAVAQSAGPTVFAAASLKTALDAVDAAWTAKTGKTVTVSYASSSALAKQIEQGAPADVFISADLDWMDFLDKKDLVRPGTRSDLVANALVLIAPAGTTAGIDIAPGFPLAAAIGDGKLATGDVRSVPAGKYAKAALTALGVWGEVEPKIAGTENVRVALALVARGEAKYGIVYATDAKSEPKVAVVGVFPAGTHPPVVYPVAITKEATSPATAEYLAFLKGPEAAKIFADQGFTPVK
ncbi:molybdate ABC transporter substrate-binding protein [Pinisolibacter sp.]|uniref:molybdate ABC transporter substrate-binding protein n=1 Tax=Pinisolibacter sp. TaxID=2172024 RepID=UPI002FDCD9ED